MPWPERIAIAKLTHRQPYIAQVYDDSGERTEWGDVYRVTNPHDVPLSSNHLSTVLIRYNEGHDECRVFKPGSVMVEEILRGQKSDSHQPAHAQEE
jgi:hypothetical protein